MNKPEFVRRVVDYLQLNEVRKHVSAPKKVLHITDDEGQRKDIIIRPMDKWVDFTAKDIGAVLDAFIYIISDALKRGDNVAIQNFGTFSLRYRKSRSGRAIGDTQMTWGAHYAPKFSSSKALRACAKIYEAMIKDGYYTDPLPLDDAEPTNDGVDEAIDDDDDDDEIFVDGFEFDDEPIQIDDDDERYGDL